MPPTTSAWTTQETDCYRTIKKDPEMVYTPDLANSDDYQAFINDMVDRLKGERVFDAKTHSGNWVTKPYTPENIDEYMSQGSVVNRVGYNEPYNDMVINSNQQFKSTTPLYKQANRLMSHELSNPTTLMKVFNLTLVTWLREDDVWSIHTC